MLGGLLGNVFGALNPLAAQQTQALTASSVPSSSARMVSLGTAGSTDPTDSADENASAATETKTDPKDVPTGPPKDARTRKARPRTTPREAGEAERRDRDAAREARRRRRRQPKATTTPPKHAKPDDDKQPGADATKDEAPKKHGPKLNVVRDGANASSPQDAKPDEKTGGAGTGKKDAETTGAADASAGGGTSTGGAASGNAA